MNDAGEHGSNTPSAERVSPETVRGWHDRFARELLAFLTGVLRDPHLASDALQATFQRACEVGHTAKAETIKGWLFQVAYREALAIRRRDSASRRNLQKYRDEKVQAAPLVITTSQGDDSGTVELVTALQPVELVVKREETQRVKLALQSLPPEQLDVVQRRIDREQTFAEIAAELQIPLGTVLTRMRLATEKLRKFLTFS